MYNYLEFIYILSIFAIENKRNLIILNTYIINREDRPERLDHAREQLSKQSLNAHVFPAVITKPGYIGCKLSHLEIMDKCRSDVTFMVLEDDVKFLGDYHTLVAQAMTELPNNFDCLFLGCSPQEPFKRYSEHLFRMGRSFTTHAIIWRNRKGGAVEYILENREKIKKIDVFFSESIFPFFECFCIYPLLCSQVQYPSDTCKRSDVSTIEKNFKIYCK